MKKKIHPNYHKIKDESDSAYAFAFPQNQRTKLIQANKQLLLRQIKRGFRPKWYCVFHLNNTINTNDEILLEWRRQRLETHQSCGRPSGGMAAAPKSRR